MGERIRRFNWSRTPLGPPEGWSPALQTTLRIVLANRFPHILWWGPQYIQFYNDAWFSSSMTNRLCGKPPGKPWNGTDTPFW